MKFTKNFRTEVMTEEGLFGFEKLKEAVEEAWMEKAEISSSSNNFVPGGIHSEKSIKFWEEQLEAGEWVLSLLREGYVLPIAEKLVTPYEEDNNASAKRNMKFVRQQVQEWNQAGIVEIVSTKPDCVSPLTVVERHTGNGEIKRRLCWDGSRHVNKALKVNKVTLAHLQVALELTKEGDWQSKYDLASAYFHIKIYPPHRRFLGAKFAEEDGSIKYFVFNFMPFGLATAVYVITKLFKPLQAFFGKNGVRHSIFIDDGRVLAASKEESKEKFQLVLDTLKQAGWQIEKKKTDPVDGGKKAMKYLGFLVNTDSMTVHLTEEKKRDLQSSTMEMGRSVNRTVKARSLAKVLGQMISAMPALGFVPLIFARRAYEELEKQVDRSGWNSTIKVSLEVAEDLQSFCREVDKQDGAPIATPERAVSVLAIVGPPSEFIKTKVIPNHVREVNQDIWCGDASQFAVCAYSIKTEKEFFFIQRFTEEEEKLSSGHRELLVVKKALNERLKSVGPWPQKTTLYWITDSENLVVFLRKGSRKREIQNQVLEVLEMAQNLNIRIEPIHLRREDPRIKIADAGSKSPDSDDWSIDAISFNNLKNRFGPFSVDLFSSQGNRKVEKFYSDFFCPKSFGVDAFCHSWDGENAWICPPVKLIIRTIRKLEVTQGTGVLIIPKWPTARFWPEVFPDGKNSKQIFKEVIEFSPFIIQNQSAKSSLKGKTKFKFLALHFQSSEIKIV